ncbi:MAG: tRNA (5-methylaminomethyl-2-thiouridine)(34)-methyltransferase MnmD [Bacteroidota bacterium]
MPTNPENNDVTFIETGDGSHSLVWPHMDEAYHSRHGAVQESRHVFLKEGIDHWRKLHPDKKSFRIFEVGFGTGLNALLCLEYVQQNPEVTLFYHSIEAYPIDLEIAQKINYPEFVAEEARSHFTKLHEAAWDEEVEPIKGFQMQKEQIKLEDWNIPETGFDVIFYDAFAPSKQGELWEFPMIEKSVLAMREGGVWVSYCATGQLRRDLKSAGLTIEKIPGPPGKREMTRGTKFVQA